MNKLLFGVVFLLATFAVGSTVLILKQRDEIESAKSDLAQATTQLVAAEKAKADADALTQHAREADLKIAELEKQVGELTAASQSARANAARLNAAVKKPALSVVATAPNQTPADSPEPSDLEAETARLAGLHLSAKVQRQYGPLFRQLNLSPEKAAALTQLLVDKKQTANDIAAAAAKGGDQVVNNADDFSDLVSATKTDVEDQIKALLGDADYEAYRDFGRSTGRSNVILQVQQSLANSGAPLSDDQVTQLDQTMQKNNVGHLNQKIINQSKPFLSTDQVQVLQNQLAEQKAAARLRTLPPPTAQPVPALQPHS